MHILNAVWLLLVSTVTFRHLPSARVVPSHRRGCNRWIRRRHALRGRHPNKGRHAEGARQALESGSRTIQGSQFHIFNPQKCDFSKAEVMFLGHLVNRQTVRPNPDKVGIIRQFPTPENSDGVRRLLDVATYISRLIPQFSAKTAKLRDLLKADASFAWEAEHQQVFELIKAKLASDKVLYIFDPSLPTQVATDASGTGLGAVLLQKNRPIAYAARSLTPAERNYSTIEKELLAMVFALRRFHSTQQVGPWMC